MNSNSRWQTMSWCSVGLTVCCDLGSWGSVLLRCPGWPWTGLKCMYAPAPGISPYYLLFPVSGFLLSPPLVLKFLINKRLRLRWTHTGTIPPCTARPSFDVKDLCTFSLGGESMKGRVGEVRKEQMELRKFLMLTLSVQVIDSGRKAFF